MKKYKNEELFVKSENLTSAEKWARECVFKSETISRKHKFTCGTKGEVIKELTFKIQFPKGVDIQTHADFEYNFANALAKTLEGEIEGYFDAQ